VSISYWQALHWKLPSQAMIHTYKSLELSAKYFHDLVISCLNGHSFILGAFTLEKCFFPFLSFELLVQALHPLSSFDDNDEEEDNRYFFHLFLEGGGRGMDD
jgi:hypothetical protein